MAEAFIGLLVLWPLAAGLACLVLRSPVARSALVLATGTVLAACALGLATQAPLTANPDVKAFWFTFDTTGQVGGQVITAKFPGKAFPDKPLVATFHADLGTLDLMAKGNIDVTSEANYDAASWIALDQLASAWAYGTEISKVEQPIYPGVGDLFGYQIITKDNLPTAGEYVAPPVDVVSFFTAKWKAQYGV